MGKVQFNIGGAITPIKKVQSCIGGVITNIKKIQANIGGTIITLWQSMLTQVSYSWSAGSPINLRESMDLDDAGNLYTCAGTEYSAPLRKYNQLGSIVWTSVDAPAFGAFGVVLITDRNGYTFWGYNSDNQYYNFIYSPNGAFITAITGSLVKYAYARKIPGEDGVLAVKCDEGYARVVKLLLNPFSETSVFSTGWYPNASVYALCTDGTHLYVSYYTSNGSTITYYLLKRVIGGSTVWSKVVPNIYIALGINPKGEFIGVLGSGIGDVHKIDPATGNIIATILPKANMADIVSSIAHVANLDIDADSNLYFSTWNGGKAFMKFDKDYNEVWRYTYNNNIHKQMLDPEGVKLYMSCQNAAIRVYTQS